MSVEGSLPTSVALSVSWFEKLIVGALDHVVVRDDVAGLVDHEAGAERLPGHGLRSGGASDGLSDAVVVDVICTTPGAARA